MFLGHEIPIRALSSSRQLEGTCIVDAFEAAPTQPNPLVTALAVRDLPETVRQVVFAPCETLRLGQGNGLSAGASEAAKPSAGHWGKMSTGQWAWLSEI